MARRHFRSGRSGGPRRETLWAFIDATATSLTATGGTIIGQLNAAALALRPFTIIRTYLEVLIISDQQAASEFQIAALGMAVVSDQASAIGVTAVPTPSTDAGSDLWFLHQWLMSSFVLVSAVGIDGDEGHHYSIDSKAMRKVNDDQDIVTVIELDSVSSGVSIFVAGRFLVKLH